MSGIIFFKTKSLKKMDDFYHKKLKMSFWLKQKNCNIYQSGNLLLGFLEAEEADINGTITVFIQDKQKIDCLYNELRDLVIKELKENRTYSIYHFYINDPEGREVEFQTFNHQLLPYHTLTDSLILRRSVRDFTKEEVSEDILNKIFELCRYSPTSRNSQSYYYLVIRDSETKKWLADTRENAGTPVKKAPIAVLVIADSSKTIRLEQDASIAGTYLMLSAFAYGLSSCWVTDMNKKVIKERFNIPCEDYIACAIALGYSKDYKAIPERRMIKDFVLYDKYQ